LEWVDLEVYMSFEKWWREQSGTPLWNHIPVKPARTIFKAGAKSELDNIRPLVESAIREALNCAGVDHRYIHDGMKEFDNLVRARGAGVEE
jgi:serine/threonine-protein kinase RIO1